MKVLLINPPWFRLLDHISTVIPMGACYIAAVLRERGHEVWVWNADFDSEYKHISEGSSSIEVKKMSSHVSSYLNRLNNLEHPIWLEVESVIRRLKPDLVGITSYTASAKSVYNVAAITKQINQEIKVVVGGPHSTVMPDEMINNSNIDFVVIGEGETTMAELLDDLDNSVKHKQIKGLYFKLNNEIFRNPGRDIYEDVNMLPFPAKDSVLGWKRLPPISFQVIYSSRGCPFKCIYCGSHRTHGRKLRLRDPINIVDEIEYTRRNFSTYNFFFCDDTFTANVSHAEAIVDEIMKRKLDITWSCQTRPENITDALARKMKESGCQRVSIGVETGSDRIRKLIKKGNTNEQIREGVKKLRKAGLGIVGFFMFGFPTETKEDMEDTVRFMKELDPEVVHCNIVTPDPGTELMEAMIQKGIIDPNSQDWTSFFHQSPDMLFTDDNSNEDIINNIAIFQKEFDKHNKYHYRKDLIIRSLFYLNLIIKEKMYKHPRYLFSKVKGLI